MRRTGTLRLAAAAAVVLLLSTAAEAAAQSGSIIGRITNRATGQPLSGAQVFVPGTNLGQLSNEEGQFLILNVPAGTHTVTARFIGFAEATQRGVVVRPGEPTRVELEMHETVLTLDELVVSGTTDPIAGVKVPFSIGRVSRENIATVPTTQSALTAIQGKVAGAQIVRNTGEPGTGVSIVLRTPTSISQSNSPLFVVDGVILSGVGGTTLDIEALDIESVEVIKGAAAASLYGSRAGSGVISITTARGKGMALDQTRIRVRSEFGYSFLGTYQWMSNTHPFRLNEAGTRFVNSAGRDTIYNQRVIKADRIMDAPWPGQTYDNVKNVLEPGLFQTQSVELSHNTASTNFMASINRYGENGTLANNAGYERANMRINLDHRLRSDFSFSMSAYHNRSERDSPTGSPFYEMIRTPPIVNMAAKGPDGKYLQLPDSTVLIENPLWRQSTREWWDRRSRTLLSGDARYNPLNWLSVFASASYDRSDNHEDFYLPKGTPLSATNPDNVADGQIDRENRRVNSYNGNLNVTATRNFGDLTARVTGRANLERENNQFLFARGTDFVVADVPDMDMTRTRTAETSLTEVRSSGYSISTGLDYAGKYIVDALIRRDGSSLFGEQERWQTYGRGAFAYRMAQESWWPVAFITEFKPRFALGTAGGRPNFSAQYETWTVNGNTGIVTKGTLGNRFLKPEHTVEREIGLDMIINNKYQLELTYAKQKTTDQIINMTIAALTGYASQWQNAGTIEGHTYEATFQAQLFNQRNFSWNTTLVWDRSNSEITEWNRSCIGASNTLGEICAGRGLGDMLGYAFLKSRDELPEYLRGRADEFDVNDDGYLVWVGKDNTYRDGFEKNLWGTTTTITGYPVTVRWGHPILRQNELGFLDAKVMVGQSNPDFQLGWMNNVNWRGLALHTHFHAQVGGETYNNTRRAMYREYRHSDMDQTGKPRELQKPVDYYFDGLASGTWFVNEEFVEDASYLKLRALSLQYRLNQSQLGRIGLDRIASNMSLGVVGRNLLTLTRYRGMDPEVGGIFFRVDQWYYPPPRTFTGIVEITF